MTLEGTFTFNGPRQTVWELLQDPAVLAEGAARHRAAELDRGWISLEGVMKVSVGPVTAAKFDVIVTLMDKTEPERFVMQIDRQRRRRLHARLGDHRARRSRSGSETLMRYTSNVQVGGRSPRWGSGCSRAVSRR